MSDSLIYYDEDQAQLRNQLIKLSRRVALMEKEQQTLSNWIKLTYAAAIGYFILKIAFWSKWQILKLFSGKFAKYLAIISMVLTFLIANKKVRHFRKLMTFICHSFHSKFSIEQ